MQKIFIKHDSTILRIYPELAKEIGLNESLMLLQLQFLISISNTEKYDGFDWTYQSLNELQENYFLFWGRDTVNRALINLEGKGLIIFGNFNKKKYDKTRWIRLNYDKLSELKSINIQNENNEKPVSKSNNLSHGLSQNATRKTQNATTIPETSTETSTENNIVPSEPPPSGKLKKEKQKTELQEIIQSTTLSIQEKKEKLKKRIPLTIDSDGSFQDGQFALFEYSHFYLFEIPFPWEVSKNKEVVALQAMRKTCLTAKCNNYAEAWKMFKDFFRKYFDIHRHNIDKYISDKAFSPCFMQCFWKNFNVKINKESNIYEDPNSNFNKMLRGELD